MPILNANNDPGRSAAQIRRLYAIAAQYGLDGEDVAHLVSQHGVDDPHKLSTQQYDDLTNLVIPGIQPVLPAHISGRVTDPHTGEIYEEEDPLGEWVVSHWSTEEAA